MTNSATSTKRTAPVATESPRRSTQTGFTAGHFFILMSMIGATVVVLSAKNTHPVALLLLSGAVISAGFVGLMMSRAVAGFLDPASAKEPLAQTAREELLREKQLVLRSIKELEFDKAMGKVSDADFASISAGLRARAITLMQDLDRSESRVSSSPGSSEKEARLDGPRSPTCAECGTSNDADARFCKLCGAKMVKA